MADVDTGLGWYADSAFLKEQIGLIGTIASGGGVPSGYTIINGIYCNGNSSDKIDTGILASDMVAFEIVSLFRGTPSSEAWLAGAWDSYYGGHGPGVYGRRQIVWYPGLRYYLPSTNDTWLDITGDCVSGVYKCNGDTLVGDGSRIYGNAPYSFYLFGGNWSGGYMRTDPLMVLAYAKIVSHNASYTYVSVERDADGAVGMYELTTGTFYIRGYKYTGAGGTAPIPSSVNAEFNKSTVGYSVTCMCKWRTSYDGDVYCSPVLISSQPNNTLYTRNGSTPSVNTTEHQYQGMTFYMRKAPLNVLDGTETITSDYPVVDLSGVAQTNDTIFAAIAYQSGLGVGYIPGDVDPYAPGGTSEPSAGTPDFTEVSESISQGSTFPISFQSTGLCRVYVPSITDLNGLANYLWTDQTFLDTIKNILINQFENFMEAVISLTMVPCQVPKGTAQPVKVMFLSTGLSFPPATQQFVEVDCGYVDITERYASALDYNPYTKVSLYLPFIGTVPLDTDEVMGHRLKCIYTIDIVSGACVAKIMVNYPDSSNGVLYQFSGHCSISMPLTAADFSSYYAAAMSGLKMAAGLAAAGAGAPGLAGTLLGEPTAHPSSTTTTTRTTERNAATGRQILTGTESRETSHTPGQASFKELATRASVNTVGAVINSKFSVEHSGGFTGNTGFLGVQAPYVIITRPDMCNPDEYGAYNGRPSMMYLHLGNLSGFTQVQNIKLTGIPATNPELGEIAELLKTGVIL